MDKAGNLCGVYATMQQQQQQQQQRLLA